MSSSRLGLDIDLAGRALANAFSDARVQHLQEEMQVLQKAPSKPSVRREFVSV